MRSNLYKKGVEDLKKEHDNLTSKMESTHI